ncbi:MAG: FecR domain-containing protein [Verrucomicrobia bacterium]|nr:FecR domain-containing protein [Verrucomicrobiota bacterium]
MNLSDREILELNELCGAVVDGTLTDAQRERLARWLRESDAARRGYVRALGQSASLHTYAAELHAGAPDAPVAIEPVPFWRRPAWFGGLAAAAALALGFIAWSAGRSGDETSRAGLPNGVVARVTGARNSQWISGTLVPGATLKKGQALELASGIAEITFDSGARVVLEGASSLEINSAWGATLRRGLLKASVPPEALGFRVSNPAVEVVDLGTEFTMIADAQGAEVLVLKGEVEAAPLPAAGQETILLREREARRFAANGVSVVSDRERKFALFAEPLALDRLVQPTRMVHWSFDEAAGRRLRADSTDPRSEIFEAELRSTTDAEQAHVGGRRGRALRYDGQTYVWASVPGLSASTPHTIAFWVRVPEEAPLSDAYSMVTWTTRSRKLGNRHAGINWNRDRTEGPLGALRTDFGGGHAIGTTSLRDGRWHHIAVCFAPGADDTDTPVQVRQYVDGRLESSTVMPGRTRGPAAPENAALADKVWLGRRLSPSGLRREHFRGELDELFIVDRGLEPHEIVSLMNDNRLPSAALATK